MRESNPRLIVTFCWFLCNKWVLLWTSTSCLRDTIAKKKFNVSIAHTQLWKESFYHAKRENLLFSEKLRYCEFFVYHVTSSQFNFFSRGWNCKLCEIIFLRIKFVDVLSRAQQHPTTKRSFFSRKKQPSSLATLNPPPPKHPQHPHLLISERKRESESSRSEKGKIFTFQIQSVKIEHGEKFLE